MQSNDDRLRLAYSSEVNARDSRVHPHPAPEALLALAERAGAEAGRLETLDHVMACATCQRELDLIRASVSAAGVPRQRMWFRSPVFATIAIAAALVIAAGIKVFMVSSGDLESGRALRGGAAVATYPARWAPAGLTLSWRPTADASSYRVELIDESGAALVDSSMRDTDTTIVVADSLTRGRRGLSWSVTATLGDGSTVASNPTRLVTPR